MPKSDIIPFPYPLGVGTDICHIPRIRRILTRENPKYAERFSKRIFSESERDAFQQRHDNVLRLKKDLDTAVCRTDENSRQQDDYDRELWRLSSWVAGRFAAKEAAMKAVYPQRLGWHHAEVLVLPGQMKPLLVIHSFQHVDTVEGNDENRPPVTKRAAQLSISHDGEYAIATVLAAID
ncbi:hypothetical protein ANOM_003931 [Aspergillus nomiae NRRL 13137]|uniref:4'-phosphopantetheinyl transferase domain-containing protein n=1 Tax=Aspergillus nomiae NRRL (strain ATCC 15546 / NRRL 13137 / CBS 260.88 / M93) TaxID=1509407 RepID=A0A0L1J6I2_ASPN3|nr:uncharacterized protein ANOM_003931 [Aspergillus nomiae NRRL 13137]KNG87352.1 hypothetical protein ANOM_003931 [Aspergillus nomiae NRRL 13137]